MNLVKSIKDVFNINKWTDDAFIRSEMLNSGTYRNNQRGFFFGGIDGTQHFFSFRDLNSSLTAYQKCPPVTAILNRKAQAFINGKTWVLNTKGKESQTEEAKKLRRLFARPNPLQSWKQFEAQGYIYQQLFGYTAILPIKPIGFKSNIDATALWNIPPFLLEIKESTNLFYQTSQKGIIDEIWLSYKNQRTQLNVENVFLMKDFTPSFDSLVIPESRIRSLQLPINNIIGAYESRNVLINHRGAQGVLSNEKEDASGTISLTPKEKDDLQSDFRKYGLKNGQWQVILSNAKLSWQQMGYPTRDLMLFEEVIDSAKSICDAYNYPPHLLGLIDPTFNNQKEAEKGLYQNSIIPDAESIYQQWNQFFGTEDLNIILDKDFCHIPALQQDELLKAQARKARNDAFLIEFRNDLMKVNRWLELNGEDTIPEGDVYFSEWKKTRGDGMAGLTTTPNQNSNNGNQPTTGTAG